MAVAVASFAVAVPAAEGATAGGDGGVSLKGQLVDAGALSVLQALQARHKRAAVARQAAAAGRSHVRMRMLGDEEGDEAEEEVEVEVEVEVEEVEERAGRGGAGRGRRQ
ncbi:hypothetical protein CHLRE_26g756697v5 [Chlamydomonas reinhardtii]|uniref:Uncharacterized protein n=1 Tax=Chlamydomonas reinhardtii TaxID=3055 RepID=A0A2K3CN06_CHLRE|nr:uncharacterized protein CHLRE_26g756697v5 [Chlamydomonas reinhardtii]PNW69667.1 hypothetical protein CHLRE_26g756697v5 [Chlamydomonas reinhardtii]